MKRWSSKRCVYKKKNSTLYGMVLCRLQVHKVVVFPKALVRTLLVRTLSYHTATTFHASRAQLSFLTSSQLLHSILPCIRPSLFYSYTYLCIHIHTCLTLLLTIFNDSRLDLKPIVWCFLPCLFSYSPFFGFCKVGILL